jgi:hypothetical protein
LRLNDEPSGAGEDSMVIKGVERVDRSCNQCLDSGLWVPGTPVQFATAHMPI